MSSVADSSMLVAAGALSGIAEAFAVQPFDIVKTRHQLNTKFNKGVIGTLFDLYKEGGVLRWYRGMAAELIGMIPKSSGMYASYEISRKTLADTYQFGDTTTVATIAGLISGVPEAIIVTPFQVIKVRMHTKEHLGRYSGSFDCFLKVLKQEGIGALSIGLKATLWRNCVWNAVYFGGMHGIKNRLPTPNSKSIDLLQTLFAAFICGGLASCFNIPFDVVKSRIQSQISNDKSSPLKYQGTWTSLYTVAKEEGILACFKGLNAKICRGAVAGSVAMTVFELMQHLADYKK